MELAAAGSDMPEQVRQYEQRKVVQHDDLQQARQLIDAELRALRQHVDDNDRLYNERAEAQREAILKAEKAQSEYNVRSNEFRGQLDDQAKTLMPRNEFNSVISNLEAKITRNSDDIRFLREGGGGQITKGVKDESRANIALLFSLVATVVGVLMVAVVLWRVFTGN